MSEDTRTPKVDVERLVGRAIDGNRAAVEALVRAVQDDIYGLALRMLYHPADAEDATQEILVRVVTRLSSFEGRSAFRTWVYRVAANYLLTTRKRRAELRELTFDDCEADVDPVGKGGPPPGTTPGEHRVLISEVRLGCMQGLLLCLDRGHRLAFVLDVVAGLSGREAAEVLEISSAAYRKRLSRARARMGDFMGRCCGLLDDENPCHCDGQLPAAIRSGWVRPRTLLFARHPAHEGGAADVAAGLEELGELGRMVELWRGQPRYVTPRSLAEGIRAMMEAGRLSVVNRD